MLARRLVPTLALLGAAALSTGCSDASSSAPDLSAELVSLRDSIDASRDASQRLATEVQRQNRRIDDLSRRVAAMDARPSHPVASGARGPASEAAEEAGAEAAGMSAPPSEIASGVAAVLASEDGKKVVAAAARGVVAESEARQRDTFVAYSLATFAEEAGLSETQSKDMRKAWDDVMAGARKIMSEAAPTADMTPEERAARVLKVRVGMQDLGRQREEAMRTILDSSQFELYEKRQKDIDAGLHGAPAGERTSSGPEESSRR